MKLEAQLLVCCTALALAGLLPGARALAQDNACGIKREVIAKPLDEQTWKRLNDIYEDVGEENYDLAYEKLRDMVERARGSEYLRAIIQQLLGQVEWARENYDASLTAFEEAVKLDALPNATHFSLMYQIAQLYYMKDRFDEALRSLDMWFCMAPADRVKASAHILKASIHAAKEEWAKVIPSVVTAIEMSDEPNESWYLLKLASHHELNDLNGARETLKDMLKIWTGKKAYWVQLSNVYFQQKKDDEALAVIALAHRKKLLNQQSDYMYLSNLYSFREVPYKAAAVLEEGIEKNIVEASEKHWKMVADAWFTAEELERALVAYEKAGQAAADGEIDLRRGYILIDLERWEDARDALTLALEKGGLNERKTGEAHLMVGMAEFNLGNLDDASAAWGRASRFEKSKKAAEQWMAHLREERARKAP